ncbi:hypothetical protein OCA23_30310 [Bacillus cereus]|nr:hypothetical protein [Bacillus cereus]
MYNNHFMADVYGSHMGYMSTSLATVPEAEDRQALPDDQKVSADLEIKQDPAKESSIWKSLGVVLVLAIALAYFGRG